MIQKEKPDCINDSTDYVMAKSPKPLLLLTVIFFLLFLISLWLNKKSGTIISLCSFLISFIFNLTYYNIFYFFEDKIIVQRYYLYPFFLRYITIECHQMISLDFTYGHKAPPTLLIEYFENKNKKISLLIHRKHEKLVDEFALSNNVPQTRLWKRHM